MDYSYDPYVAGCMLYGASGEKGKNLDESGSYAGADEAFGLLCRGPTEDYKGNAVTTGDLLSSADPSSYKFRKMQYNGCHAPYANLLSMQCEKFNHNDWMNPYFVIEMTSDVKFVYDLMEAFYPYYDEHNDSNFSFLPITWANNLLQDWSDCAGGDAVDSSKSTTDARLSCPKKSESGHKKVLILVVNKPDQFEPGELTYLGFNNDYAEIPSVDGDTISFKTDFSDTSRKFADGTAYDGTVQGQKKILKYTTTAGNIRGFPNYGYFGSSATVKLTFPQKALVRLKVEGLLDDAKLQFLDITPDSETTTTDEYQIMNTREFNILPEQITAKDGEEYCVTCAIQNILLISAGITNRPCALNGEEGQKKLQYANLEAPKNSVFINIRGSDETIKYVNNQDNRLIYGENSGGSLAGAGIKYDKLFTSDYEMGDWLWKLGAWDLVFTADYDLTSVMFSEDMFTAISSEKTYCSLDGTDWKGLISSGSGVYVALGANGEDRKNIYRSTDGGATWDLVYTNTHSTRYSGYYFYFDTIKYENGTFIATEKNTNSSSFEYAPYTYYSADGINWQVLTQVAYGNGVYVGINDDHGTSDGKNDRNIYCFADGQPWETVYTNTHKCVNSAFYFYFDTITFAGGVFIATEDCTCNYDGYPYGHAHYTYYSLDGRNWAALSSTFAFGKGVYVGVNGRNVYCNAPRGWYFYSNSGTSSTGHNFFLKYPGDAFFLTDSELYSLDVGNTRYNLNAGAEYNYIGGGLHRFLMNSEKMKKDSGDDYGSFSWIIENLEDHKLPAVAAGVTLPVNLALSCFKEGVDQREVLNEVSKDACAKLKKDFGNNMEVYVINFRGQGDADECASGTDHVYSAANQEELEKILEKIESKIKEGDRYRKARVVN